MGNIFYAHGYRNAPRETVATHGSPLRNTFKNTYDGSLSPQFLRSYLTAAKISSTTVTKTTVSSDQSYRPTITYPDFKKQPDYNLNLDHNTQPGYQIASDYQIQSDYKNRTICKKNKNIASAADESKIINVAQPSKAVEDTLANSMSKIDQPYRPYQPYVTHTYFTLDDVILPYIPEPNSTSKSKQENRSQFEPEKENEDKASSTSETLNTLFDMDIFNIEPITSTTAIITTTSTASTTTTTTTAEAPQTTFSPKTKNDFYTEPIQLATSSPTEALATPNTTSNFKNWNSTLNLSPRKILKLDKFNNNACENCRKSQLAAKNVTLNNLAKQTEETKLETSKKRSSILLKKNDGIEGISQFPI
ncbi:uncharacterized protein LOC111600093 [Drosophila hydei]|uniref:Uncharacterized protein LOC111600093 n=1 Tax=Drosophila hydei TaxID=7224 RepID=A0A6J1LWY1_DROHY|nr:uncharacterized protein LOC111600093 [Drosophila hydei]